MDNREAKFLLSAYRPNGQDVNDPRFAEALAQARRDPILERWFRESIEFDAAITKKLSSVPVPSDLPENILAGAKISRPSQAVLLKWAIAAGFILIALVGSIVLRQVTKPRLAGWQEEGLRTISSLVAGQTKFDAESDRGTDLIEWLKTNRGPTAERLPKNLEKVASIGCKTFSWNGTPVSVICFVRRDSGLVHLVATRAPLTQREGEPQFVQRGKWVTATWREGDTIYMLALEGSLDQLRNYLL
ncbi:MAG TPA: hypothetical protein VKE30_01645 [Chthoniobacterales bacterium]|nr:hypothetical protein [Chthoniobacterales bacterium]